MKLHPRSFLATQVFASHSLWHMCVLCAVYVWFHFLLQYQVLLKDHGCSAYGYGGVANEVVTAVTAAVCDSATNATCSALYQ